MPEKGMQDASTKSQSFVGSGSFAISVDSGEDLGVDANPDHPGIDSSDDDSTDDDKLPRPRSLSYKGRSMRGKRAKRASRTTSDRRTDENVQTANSGRANYKYDQKAVLIIATALLNNARANQVYAKLNDDVASSRGVPSQNGVAQFCTRMTKLSVQVATKFEQLSDKQWLMSESGDDDDVLSEELACAFTPLLKSVCAKDAAWQGELSIKLVRALVKLGKAKLEKQAETAAAALRASQEQEQMVAVEQSALKAAARRSPRRSHHECCHQTGRHLLHHAGCTSPFLRAKRSRKATQARHLSGAPRTHWKTLSNRWKLWTSTTKPRSRPSRRVKCSSKSRFNTWPPLSATWSIGSLDHSDLATQKQIGVSQHPTLVIYSPFDACSLCVRRLLVLDKMRA